MNQKVRVTTEWKVNIVASIHSHFGHNNDHDCKVNTIYHYKYFGTNNWEVFSVSNASSFGSKLHLQWRYLSWWKNGWGWGVGLRNVEEWSLISINFTLNFPSLHLSLLLKNWQKISSLWQRILNRKKLLCCALLLHYWMQVMFVIYE